MTPKYCGFLHIDVVTHSQYLASNPSHPSCQVSGLPWSSLKLFSLQVSSYAALATWSPTGKVSSSQLHIFPQTSVHRVTQQTFVKHLPYARHYAISWDIMVNKRWTPCPCGIHSLEGGDRERPGKEILTTHYGWCF